MTINSQKQNSIMEMNQSVRTQFSVENKKCFLLLQIKILKCYTTTITEISIQTEPH